MPPSAVNTALHTNEQWGHFLRDTVGLTDPHQIRLITTFANGSADASARAPFGSTVAPAAIAKPRRRRAASTVRRASNGVTPAHYEQWAANQQTQLVIYTGSIAHDAQTAPRTPAPNAHAPSQDDTEAPLPDTQHGFATRRSTRDGILLHEWESATPLHFYTDPQPRQVNYRPITTTAIDSLLQLEALLEENDSTASWHLRTWHQ